jgi:glycerophosphoryl diester phosphodiesterase
MNYRDFMADPQRDCAIIAHRGIWRDAPENSLLAIERAIADGHDAVEIDVRRSADGRFFLHHDANLLRMTGHDATLEDVPASQLTGLLLRNRAGGVGNSLTEHRLPSLGDVFELTRGRILIHLDVKDRNLIPDVIAEAKAMGVDQEVDVWAELRNADDLAWINEHVTAQNVAFVAKTRLNVPDAMLQTELVFLLKPLICEVYFSQVEQVAALRERFHDAGIALWVNTLDDVSCAGLTDTAARHDPDAVWGRLIDAGVSAIQTDEAALLRRYLTGRAKPSTSRL